MIDDLFVARFFAQGLTGFKGVIAVLSGGVFACSRVETDGFYYFALRPVVLNFLLADFLKAIETIILN